MMTGVSLDPDLQLKLARDCAEHEATVASLPAAQREGALDAELALRECAMALHAQVKDRLSSIERIVIETQEPAVRIIDKVGPLANPADRDHCIQYMVAVPLIFGRLTAADYEDAVSSDPRIDNLRAKMQVRENTVFTKEYYERDKRHIGNAVHVFFGDGSKLETRVDFPVGHRKRRAEGIPLLVEKFDSSVAAHFPARQTEAIKALFARKDFESIAVNEFMAALVAN
jgi:2-methylcitrate dehydratase